MTKHGRTSFSAVFVISDPMPQTSKASASTVEADQSIDEILGLQVLNMINVHHDNDELLCVSLSDIYSSLQGEIHMSDDAIHDILEQTESDPAFQALYDLFDYSNYDQLCLYCVRSAAYFRVREQQEVVL